MVAWNDCRPGMLMLAFVFQTLAIRKPDLDAGPVDGEKQPSLGDLGLAGPNDRGV
jgi:hypothetical protein